MLNGWISGNDVVANTTYRISWSRRSSDYPGIVAENDPLDIAQAGVSYNVWVKQGGAVKVTQCGVVGNQLDINGERFELGEIEVLIEAVADDGKSLVTKDVRWIITL